MQRTYQELVPEQDFSHLAQTVEQYFSRETPLWWVESATYSEPTALLPSRQPVALDILPQRWSVMVPKYTEGILEPKETVSYSCAFRAFCLDLVSFREVLLEALETVEYT